VVSALGEPLDEPASPPPTGADLAAPSDIIFCGQRLTAATEAVSCDRLRSGVEVLKLATGLRALALENGTPSPLASLAEVPQLRALKLSNSKDFTSDGGLLSPQDIDEVAAALPSLEALAIDLTCEVQPAGDDADDAQGASSKPQATRCDVPAWSKL
jgi:hypothetical protein